MPVSSKTAADRLLTPQARVLAALMPETPDQHSIDWPTINRAQLAVRAGYTAVSGTVTRALNGVHSTSSVNRPHLGLIDRGLIEQDTIDIEGRIEVCYRVTTAGVAAYREYLVATGGALPKARDRAKCVNDRYVKEPDKGVTK